MITVDIKGKIKIIEKVLLAKKDGGTEPVYKYIIQTEDSSIALWSKIDFFQYVDIEATFRVAISQFQGKSKLTLLEVIPVGYSDKSGEEVKVRKSK